jgi:hypothetical protein
MGWKVPCFRAIITSFDSMSENMSARREAEWSACATNIKHAINPATARKPTNPPTAPPRMGARLEALLPCACCTTEDVDAIGELEYLPVDGRAVYKVKVEPPISSVKGLEAT